MNLSQKREVVRRFKGSKTIGDLAQVYFKLNPDLNWIEAIEDTIRDFLNGKFTLGPGWKIEPKWELFKAEKRAEAKRKAKR